MKARRKRRVPLSVRAGTILRALQRDAAFVFPGERRGEPFNNMPMAVLLKRMTPSDTSVPQRVSRLGSRAHPHQLQVIEMALAHAVGDKIEAAFRRGDLMATRVCLIADWARCCTTPQRNTTITQIGARNAT